MIAASSLVLFFYLSKVYPNGYIAVGYLLFLQEQIKDHHHHQAIYHKSSPARGCDGCTFGADLRVCGLWVCSRSLAANHAGGPGYILLLA
jgi:hypothetical protein